MKTRSRNLHISGVRLRLHYGWLIVAFLLTLIFVRDLRLADPNWGWSAIWISAVLAGLLFFSSFLIHGIAHAAVAARPGLTVHAITVTPFGCEIESDTYLPTAKSEILMSAIGLLANSLLGLISLDVAYGFGWIPFHQPDTAILNVLVWLGYTNVGLTLFYLIPGLPLDGGRILRGLILWGGGSLRSATRVAATIGEIVALALIMAGTLLLIDFVVVDGLVLCLLGGFLLKAALDEENRTQSAIRLRNTRVGEAMLRDFVALDAGLDLKTAASDLNQRGGKWCFVVDRDAEFVGVVTRNEFRAVEAGYWPYRSLQSIICPEAQTPLLHPDALLVDALRMMDQHGVDRLAVGRAGRLVGVISRAQLLDSGTPLLRNGPTVERRTRSA
ncbi:MAG TPA: CBS domain-containing protein [Blastocatellia bacterium]|nr:CBS domain-containing protein [Blastocatellia bacterium]